MAAPLKVLAIATAGKSNAEVSPHAKFTGTLTTIPALSLGQTQYVAIALTPVVAGDALVANEDISVVFTADLPAGINIASVQASATNTARIGFTSSALLSLQTVNTPCRVTAHR